MFHLEESVNSIASKSVDLRESLGPIKQIVASFRYHSSSEMPLKC